VPSFAIERPDLIKVAHIENENNAEVRRILIERMGVGKYLAEVKAEVVEWDGGIRGCDGSSNRVLMRSKHGMWLVGTDGSTERVYYMSVPDDVKTPSEAHRRISGVDDESRLIFEA
jgi:hypothetical protein